MDAGTKYFVAIVVIGVSGWGIKQPNEISKGKWLIGTWENKTAKGSIYETWSKINDNEFSGKSYTIKEKDTIVYENIRMVQEHNGLFYIPTVNNQNKGLPVRFVNKTISETQMVFENAEHDFPQTITYTKINPDSLIAEISGTKSGHQRNQIFTMRRVK